MSHVINPEQRVGITSGLALHETQHHPQLEDAVISQLVRRTLLCIRDIFSTTEARKSSPQPAAVRP